MGINEGFNVEAAKTAFSNAQKEIEELLNKFQQTHQNVQTNFDGQGGKDIALGGNLGTVARNSFEEESGKAFDLLRANMDNFMTNRIDPIMRNSMTFEDEARSTYGS